MTTHEEFNLLLDNIRSRCDVIQQVNETSLDRENAEFGLEAMEGYIADIRGLIYEENG